MALPLLAKVGIGGGLALAGWALFGGEDEGSTSPRVPYTAAVRIPGTPALPWETVDDSLCLSWDAVGSPNASALLADLWSRLYPNVPMPPVAGDHPSVPEAFEAISSHVSVFVNDVQQGKPVCEPGEEPPPPPPPGDDVATVAEIEALFTDKPRGFARVQAGDSLTAIARRAYGLAATQTGDIRRAIGCIATVGYNMLFAGRRQPGNDYGRGQTDGAWYDVNWAMLPRHADPRVVAAARAAGDKNAKLRRWIGWESGNMVQGSPGRYFALWLPPMLAVGGGVNCIPSGTWNPERNPPLPVLRAIGWPGGLPEMRTAWLAGTIEGPEA